MLFATDLDSTLVYPARTQPAEQPTVPAEYRDSTVLTLASTELSTALADLTAAGVELVPVTARSREMLDGLIPFSETRVAVTAAGGRIWRNGQQVLEWDRELARILGDAASPVQARSALAAEFAGAEWIIGEQAIDGVWFFLLAPHDQLPPGAEPRARAALAPLGWTAYGHGRKLYCMPSLLRKETAARWLAEWLGSPIIGTAGDSEMDLGLLELAPVALCPAGSSLASSPLRPAHVRVTQAPAAGAGPEILRTITELAVAR